MGDYDLVEAALIEQKVDLFFRKVAIRPGKPAVFGRKGSCLVFGLPGNPVSSLIVFEVLVAPAIRKMLGMPRPEGEIWEAVAEASVHHRPGRATYLPGRLQREGSTLRVAPVPSSGSADLRAHSRADVLIIIPADRERIDAGERASVLPLRP